MSGPRRTLSREQRMKAMFDHALKLVEKHETFQPASKPEPTPLKVSKVKRKSGTEDKVPSAELITPSTSSISTISSITATGDTDEKFKAQNNILNQSKYLNPKAQKSPKQTNLLIKAKPPPAQKSKSSIKGAGDNKDDSDYEYSDFSCEDSSGQEETLQETHDKSKVIDKSVVDQKSKSINVSGPSSLQAISSVKSSKPETSKSKSVYKPKSSLSQRSQPKTHTSDNTLSSIKTERSASTIPKSQDLPSGFLPKSKLSEKISQTLAKSSMNTSLSSSIAMQLSSGKYSKSVRSLLERQLRFTPRHEKVLLKSQRQQMTSDWIESTSESLSNGSVSGDWLKKSMTGRVKTLQLGPASQTTKPPPSKTIVEPPTSSNNLGSQESPKITKSKQLGPDNSFRTSKVYMERKIKEKAIDNSDTSVSEQLPEDTPRVSDLGAEYQSTEQEIHQKDMFSPRKLNSMDHISLSAKIAKDKKIKSMQLPPEPKVPNDIPIRDLVLSQQKKQKDRSSRILEQLRKKSLPELYNLNKNKDNKAFERKMNREIDSIMRQIVVPSGASSNKSYDSDFISPSETPKSTPLSEAEDSPQDPMKSDRPKTGPAGKSIRRNEELTGLFNHVMAANAEVFLQALQTAKELKKISMKQKQKLAQKSKKRKLKKKKPKTTAHSTQQPKIYIKNLLMH